MNIKDELLVIIDNEIGDDLNTSIYDIPLDDELFQYGIDSLNIMKVILGIEEKYDVVYDDEELNIENFMTISAICDTVEEKLGIENEN